VTAINGFTAAIGDQFTIIDNDGTDPVVGTFDGLPEGKHFTGRNNQFGSAMSAEREATTSC